MAYDPDNPPNVELEFQPDGIPELKFDEDDFDNDEGDEPIGAFVEFLVPPRNALGRRYVSFGSVEVREDDDGDEYECDEHGVYDNLIHGYEWNITECEWLRHPPEVRPDGWESSTDPWYDRVAIRIEYVYDCWEVN